MGLSLPVKIVICVVILTITIATVCLVVILLKPDYVLQDLQYSPQPVRNYRNLIVFDHADEKNCSHWVRIIDKFLGPYQQPLTPDKMYCESDTLPPISKRRCAFNLTTLDICKPGNNYGYSTGTPCVYLKLSPIDGFVPKFFNNVSELPEDMPIYLKKDINKYINEDFNKSHNVWVHCEGKEDDDKRRAGTIKLMPSIGFPGHFFPVYDDEDNTNPLIAVHFENPQRFVEFEIVCSAWSPSYIYNKKNTTFSLYIG